MMRSTPIEELFAQTLLGNYDDDEPWKAVRELRRCGTREVFEYAAAWTRSEDPLRRARGLDVLAQLGVGPGRPQHGFPEESFAVVATALHQEQEIEPLSSAIFALGHINDRQAAGIVAPFHTHPHPEVRYAVACALGGCTEEPLAVQVLLTLVRDDDSDVRDWATFGLGVLGDQDSAEIRDALFERLADTSEEVREEAMVGLAKRQDSSVLPLLLQELEQPMMTQRIIDAAVYLLGFDEDRKEWSGGDYSRTLRERFGGCPG